MSWLLIIWDIGVISWNDFGDQVWNEKVFQYIKFSQKYLYWWWKSLGDIFHEINLLQEIKSDSYSEVVHSVQNRYRRYKKSKNQISTHFSKQSWYFSLFFINNYKQLDPELFDFINNLIILRIFDLWVLFHEYLKYSIL